MTFDPLMEERVAPGVVVPRHDSGDPMIVPRGGVEPIRYTRASGLADYLAYHGRALSDWRARYEAQGIARHPDLAARIAAVRYSTGPLTGTMPISKRKDAAAEIDECREMAAQRMGIDEAANLGTAGHSLTEPGNEGQASEHLADVVSGYHEVTAGLERVASEVFVANDALRSAGTFDSLYISPEYPGYVLIGDTKTGKNYHQAQFEIQLATYAGGEVYLGGPRKVGEWQTDAGAWEPVIEDQRLTFEEFAGLPVHPDVGLLVHVSITGAPKPRVVKLDLARGRRLAAVAAATRDGRAELDKIGIGEKMDHRAVARQALDAALAGMTTREQGIALWRRFESIWTDQDNETVKARLA